jgi:asparagine synthase (glutamine-hydrolysing)
MRQDGEPLRLNGAMQVKDRDAGSWWLSWGNTKPTTQEPVWQDQHVALYCATERLDAPARAGRATAATPFGPYFCATGQYVLVGDLSFNPPQSLTERPDLDPLETPQNCLERIIGRWRTDGLETLRSLRGGYGLVIIDRWQQRLWMIRDPVGINTLYYTSAGSQRWIAPQLRLLAPYRSNALDEIALRDYLCCAFVPGERTMWSDIRELRPGMARCLPEDSCAMFFDLKEQIIAADQPLEWHGERLRKCLVEVVAESLPHEDPVGVYLSGGLDSSCITAILSHLHPKPVHSFSLHFGHELPNELSFADLLASHCQTQHHVLKISMRDLWRELPATMAELDDPIGDPLTVPNLLLGRLAKQYVDVIFNGEGGDPCFGGPKNQPMLMHRLYQPVNNRTTLQAFLSSFQKCATDLPRLLNADLWRRVQDQPSVFADDLAAASSYLNRLMTLNIKYKGADHILTKVCNLTRAARLRACSPLFDRRIVEMSMQIPPHYKVSGPAEKIVLKNATARYLPHAILERPKSGMMVPVQLGFRHHWHRQAKRLLLDRRAAISGILAMDLIQDWLNYTGDPWNRYGVKLWLLCSLEYWLKANRL